MGEPVKCCFCDALISDPARCLTLLKKPVCSLCEERLVNLTVDQAQYDCYKERIKQIWFQA